MQQEDTEWKVPSNFRIPLPALERKANIFLDFTSDSDSSNLSSADPANSDSNSSLSASIVKKLSNTVDVALTFDIYGGWDIGPKVKLRYEKRWEPWSLKGEQQVFVRTDDGWGGAPSSTSTMNSPTRPRSSVSRTGRTTTRNSTKWISSPDSSTGGVSSATRRSRRRPGWSTTPTMATRRSKHADDPDPDDDHVYARVRVIGRAGRPWIEWELMPGYYYKWEQDDPGRWGIEARVSIMYESYLRGRK